METHALRRIAKGEEITVTYTHVMSTAAERQAALKKRSVHCTCPACMDPEVSDKERERVVKALLPKTTQGVQHAEEVLAVYEATGLQGQPRYIDLLRRVANIHRKKGSNARADELEMLARKIVTAQKGRNYKEPKPEPTKPSTPFRVIEMPVDDMLRFMSSDVGPRAGTTLLEAYENFMKQERARTSSV